MAETITGPAPASGLAELVPDLPKTSTGKVMRRELKTLDG